MKEKVDFISENSNSIVFSGSQVKMLVLNCSLFPWNIEPALREKRVDEPSQRSD
jgi:hypothetical protein